MSNNVRLKIISFSCKDENNYSHIINTGIDTLSVAYCAAYINSN